MSVLLWLQESVGLCCESRRLHLWLQDLSSRLKHHGMVLLLHWLLVSILNSWIVCFLITLLTTCWDENFKFNCVSHHSVILRYLLYSVFLLYPKMTLQPNVHPKSTFWPCLSLCLTTNLHWSKQEGRWDLLSLLLPKTYITKWNVLIMFISLS